MDLKKVYDNGKKKCGEITTFSQLGSKIYTLDCIFCDLAFLHLKEFSEHIDEIHHENMYETLQALEDDAQEFVVVRDVRKHKISDESTINTPQRKHIKVETNNVSYTEIVEIDHDNTTKFYDETASTLDHLNNDDVASILDEDDIQFFADIENISVTSTGDNNDHNDYNDYNDYDEDDDVDDEDDDDDDNDNVDNDDADDDDDEDDDDKVNDDGDEKNDEDINENSIPYDDFIPSLADDDATAIDMDEDDDDYDRQLLADNNSNDNVEMEKDNHEILNEEQQKPTQSNRDVTDEEDIAFLSHLVDFYKEHRVLWQVNHKSYGERSERQKAWRKITIQINKYYNTNWDWKKSSLVLGRLRNRYSNEIYKKNHAAISGNPFTPSWYYEKFSFMYENNKEKYTEERILKMIKKKSVLPLPLLSYEEHIQLIEIYKSFTCLWDEHHPENRFREKRRQSYDEMLSRIEEDIGIKWKRNELEIKINRLRYACTQEKYRQLYDKRHNNIYKPESIFYEHIKFLLDDVPPFVCEYCDELFNTIDPYKMHVSKHDGKSPYPCSICKRGFNQVSNRTVHLRRHTKEYNFECEYCGNRYATHTDRKAHIRCHTGEKPYFCELCGKNFRTSSFFTNHMRRHLDVKPFNCKICPKRFWDSTRLREHMSVHVEERDFICTICNKGFKNKKHLRQHINVHDEEKRYECTICGKKFAQLAGLHCHKKLHGSKITGINADDETN